MRLAPSRARLGFVGVASSCLALLAPWASGQVMTDPNLVVTPYVTGLNQPVTMGFLGPDDFLFTQKADGQVRRVIGGVLQGGNVLDVPVSNDSEEGLLGLAILQGSPIRVFLYYTESNSDGGAPLGNRVYRYDWNGSALVNPLLIVDQPATPGPNHDGGVVLLDSSARVFTVIGDLNRNGQLQNFEGAAAPDNTSVISRVNSDGTPAAGNPFTPYCSNNPGQTCSTNPDCPGGTCLTQVARYWAYGVRNCFGMTIDPMTGFLWDTENGENVMDEVNVVASGFNSGWEDCMGPSPLDGNCNVPGGLFIMPGGGSSYSEPEFSWQNTIAPTGILFPVGTTWGPTYDSVALVGDNNNGNIYRFPLNGGRTGFDLSAFPPLLDLVADNGTEQNLVRIGQGFGGITDFKVGPDNNVYVVNIFGTIYRISGPVPVSLSGFSVE